MGEERCFRCDRLLFPGKQRYVVTIRIARDPEHEGPEVCYVEGGLRGIFRSQDSDGLLPGEEAEMDMTFVLCSSCRRDFMDNPLSLEFSSSRRPAYLH